MAGGFILLIEDIGKLARLTDKEYRNFTQTAARYVAQQTGQTEQQVDIEKELSEKELSYFDCFLPRLMQDIKKYNSHRENGKLGGRPPKGKSKEPNVFSENLANQMGANESISTSISTTTSITKNNNIYTPDFEKFWSVYPKTVAKNEAYEAFQKVDVDVDTLIAAVECQMKTESWQDEKYIPYAAKWLNGRRWEDELHYEQETKPKRERWVETEWDEFGQCIKGRWEVVED